MSRLITEGYQGMYSDTKSEVTTDPQMAKARHPIAADGAVPLA